MRIYMAAFYQSRGGNKGMATSTPNLRVRLENAEDNWFLESYHYMKDSPTEQALRDTKSTVFLDSGAFTMFTQGTEIDLKAYGKYVKNNQDIIHKASNLDAIGAGKEQLTYNNQKELESYGIDIGPVHHARDDDRWLKRYIDEGYDYIFLGGMVPEETAYLLNWLNHLWHNYLTKKDGTPRFKVHGFGLTSLPLMYRYPWFSVDSTSWVMVSRFGGVIIDFPQPDGTIKDFKIQFSKDSPARRVLDFHFDNSPPEVQEMILDRLEQLEAERIKNPQLEDELADIQGYKQGYNFKALSEMYGWRDHFNINYFKRAQDRRVYTFKREQETLFV